MRDHYSRSQPMNRMIALTIILLILQVLLFHKIMTKSLNCSFYFGYIWLVCTLNIIFNLNVKIGSENSLVTYYNSNVNDMKLTPYQRTLYLLNSDERWQREIALGRRIGLYRFRGEIGNGNFSQVKVAIHCLTKGKKITFLIIAQLLHQPSQIFSIS